MSPDFEHIPIIGLAVVLAVVIVMALSTLPLDVWPLWIQDWFR